jgi:hypothetical protein
MEYLGKRANRFWRNGRLSEEEMEEIIMELKRAEEERGNGDIESNTRVAEHAALREAIAKGLLQPHGTPPNTKQGRIFQLLCKNPNGLNNRITGNHKLSKTINIKDDLKADGLLYSEHRLNLHCKDNKNNFKQMFQREVACKAITAHNVHHGVSRVQEGATGMVAFGDTTGYISKVGKDSYGLGRWCWTLYGGSKGHRTRVIVSYNGCKNNKKDSQTMYQQQHHNFITKKKDLTYPNKLFLAPPTKATSRMAGSRGLNYPFMDHNEHTYDGPLGRALADTFGLGLRKAVLQHTGTRMGATFFRGSKPIDGLWVSSNIDIANVCVMLFGYGVGDHRMFVFDVTLESLFGKMPTKIVRPAWQ